MSVANLTDLTQLKKLVVGIEARSIIQYIQNDPGTTTDKVAKHLQKEKICSRLTTLNVIEKLLWAGIIKDDRKGKYFHSLTYNKDFDFRELGIQLLKGSLDEIKNAYNTYSKDDKYDRLFDELKSVIENFDNTPRKLEPILIQAQRRSLYGAVAEKRSTDIIKKSKKKPKNKKT